MLFAIGSRVRFIHTGAEGVVTAQLDADMLMVQLEDGDEIPAFVDDLQRVDDPEQAVKAKVVPGKQIKTEAPPEWKEPAMQYSILKSMGIQLAFDPVLRTDGSTAAYDIYLINDTRFDVLFSFQLNVQERTIIRKNGKLDSINAERLGQMLFDQLNDAPRVLIECWQLTTAGSGPRLEKELRIKAKQFFKSMLTAPILNKAVHHYKLFENFEKADAKGEDLSSYTKRKAKLGKKVQNHWSVLHQLDVNELASFVPEIDLHIEQLTYQHKGMSNADILRTQLAHFEEFMAKAIRLGVDRVFIIHGVGKGKLRNEIANRLIKMSDVHTFKNEYHARYGYGATEVVLKQGV